MLSLMLIFGIAALVVYLLGIAVDIHCETMQNVKFHDGGFLNMGYTTCNHRDASPKDVRRALIWPLRLVFWFSIATFWLVHDLLKGILLIFNFRYGETKLYKKIDKGISRWI